MANYPQTHKMQIASQMAVRDPDSLIRGGTGGQIDWDKVGNWARTGSTKVKLNGAAVPGATSITVDALTDPVVKGEVLDFGVAEDVVVTVGAAGALATATTLPVDALSGPLPDNALLDFGTNKFARLNGAAAAGATSLTVDALPTDLVDNDTATYKGGRMLAKLTESGEVGETALTVEALELPIPDNSEAFAGADDDGTKWLPAMTILAKDATSHLYFPRRDVTESETAIAMLATNAGQNSKTDSLSGYGLIEGGSFWENYLPDADPTTGLITAGWKTEMRAAGGFWKFDIARDSRAD